MSHIISHGICISSPQRKIVSVLKSVKITHFCTRYSGQQLNSLPPYCLSWECTNLHHPCIFLPNTLMSDLLVLWWFCFVCFVWVFLNNCRNNTPVKALLSLWCPKYLLMLYSSFFLYNSYESAFLKKKQRVKIWNIYIKLDHFRRLFQLKCQ